MGMFSKIIYDAGHTEVEPNTPTVCVVGPYHDEQVTSITNHLPLLID
jgi:peptidyl-tRNA hydrolase